MTRITTAEFYSMLNRTRYNARFGGTPPVNFQGCDYSEVDFQRDVEDGSVTPLFKLEDVRFDGSSFYGVKIDSLWFINCSFDRCDFGNAKLFNLKFINCKFKDANFDFSTFLHLQIRSGLRLATIDEAYPVNKDSYPSIIYDLVQQK